MDKSIKHEMKIGFSVEGSGNGCLCRLVTAISSRRFFSNMLAEDPLPEAWGQFQPYL